MKNAYKSELDPNNKQSRAMRQHVGAARWAYNWGLERIKQAAAKGERWPSAVDLHREGNKLKGTEALPWGYAVSKCAFQEALRNLQAGVDNWLTTVTSAKRGNARGCGWNFPSARPASTDWALAAEPSRCWMDASSCRASASCV